MTESIRRTPAELDKVIDSADPVIWRRESNRQREIALRLAREYQVSAKAPRARDHNEGLSPAERRTLSQTAQSDHTRESGVTK